MQDPLAQMTGDETRRLLCETESIDLALGGVSAFGEILYRPDTLDVPRLIGLQLENRRVIVGPTLAAARHYRGQIARLWPAIIDRGLLADRDLWAMAEETIRAGAYEPWAVKTEWLLSTRDERYLARLIRSVDDYEDELDLYRIVGTGDPEPVPVEGTMASGGWLERIYNARIIGPDLSQDALHIP